MSSLYHRLNLTKVSRRTKGNIWDRINLVRPVKPRCTSCRSLAQINWCLCPHCGSALVRFEVTPRHCIWVDPSGVIFDDQNREAMLSILGDSFSKVFSAFRGIQVFLTSEPPESKEWGDDFTHVYLLLSNDQPVDYLGIASFRSGTVTGKALVRLDQILNASHHVNLNQNQISNLVANTIAHEIGHTLGLDHSSLMTDVMHDGLDHGVHSLMPPSFHAEQILMMNRSIHRHKASSRKS
jgi:hypothetical protein